MKPILIFLLVIVGAIFNASSQTLSLKSPKDITLHTDGTADGIEVKEPDKTDEMLYLVLLVKDRTAGTTLKFKLSDANKGTADKGKDYVYAATSLQDKTIDDSSVDYFTVPITIKADQIAELDESFSIDILFTNEDGSPVKHTVKVVIKDAKDPSKTNKADTAFWYLKIVTAGNFDFFSGPTFKNFAGDLKLFAPGIWDVVWQTEKKNAQGTETRAEKRKKVGFQFGIFNYKYSEADSSRGNIHNEAYLLKGNITKIIPDTTKYVRDIYALNSKTEYNIWGLYFNPMITLSSNEWAQIYLNLHLEEIVRQQRISYSSVPLRKDTLLVTQNQVLQAFPGIRSLYNSTTFYDSYVGIGIPLKLNVKKLFDFYFDPTFGATSYVDSYLTRGATINGVPYNSLEIHRKISPFLLFKGQISTSVAPVDIILGGEYRAVINKNNYLSLYLGAAITIDKLKK